MNVLVLVLDGSLPNIAAMRIVAHHRAAGSHVELRRVKTVAALQPRLDDPPWDRVYGSLIFEKTRPLAMAARAIYPHIMLGGTGWEVASSLADVGIDERGPLDYSFYPRFQRSIGFTMRGCRLRCEFCVVPRKEGKARANATISEIWRGEPYPRELLLLDNDLFGHPDWPSVVDAIVDGGFKVSFVQGINARFLDEETAAALGRMQVRDDGMKRRRLYTAWDGKKDEKRLMRGLEALVKHGKFSPDMLMVYMLIGADPGETHADRDYRRAKLRAFGCRPYPMPFTRTPELVAFQRWVIQRHDLHTTWEQFWGKAAGEPRKLGKRRVTLPLFPDVCAHPNTKRGKDIPRRWGTYRSEVCLDCGMFRPRTHITTSDHLGEVAGDWRPADEYEDATTPEDLD